MFELEFIGTGNAGGVPLWGCECRACLAATSDNRYRRGPSSLAIRTEHGVTLIDAGCTNLAQRYSYDSVQRVVLTHYHMDHVQGLFQLRWCERDQKIPVYGPEDELGADDLYKHPGVLEFQAPLRRFEPLLLETFTLTPLPLIHSRSTFGYLIDSAKLRIAYLTDTVGLPEATEAFLSPARLDYLIIDCSHPPTATAPRNHNDLNLALQMAERFAPRHTLLTHISHHLDAWLLEHRHALPKNLEVAYDGMLIRC